MDKERRNGATFRFGANFIIYFPIVGILNDFKRMGMTDVIPKMKIAKRDKEKNIMNNKINIRKEKRREEST